MQDHTNVLSTNITTTKRMYKVELWSRNSHGNKKDLISTSLYPTKEEANAARTALIRLSRGRTFVPVDAECMKLGRPEMAIFNETNYMVN
jgi:hypothetical protein